MELTRKNGKWCPGYSYKQMVSHCLQILVDQGMTHAEIGHALADEKGPVRGNVVSMHLYPDNPVTPFPVDRLPKLAAAVKLKPIECLRLARQRTIDHPGSASAMSQPTFDWMLANTLNARREVAYAH